MIQECEKKLKSISCYNVHVLLFCVDFVTLHYSFKWMNEVTQFLFKLNNRSLLNSEVNNYDSKTKLPEILLRVEKFEMITFSNKC